jgi:hypothetical protein
VTCTFGRNRVTPTPEPRIIACVHLGVVMKPTSSETAGWRADGDERAVRADRACPGFSGRADRDVDGARADQVAEPARRMDAQETPASETPSSAAAARTEPSRTTAE